MTELTGGTENPFALGLLGQDKPTMLEETNENQGFVIAVFKRSNLYG